MRTNPIIVVLGKVTVVTEDLEIFGKILLYQPLVEVRSHRVNTLPTPFGAGFSLMVDAEKLNPLFTTTNTFATIAI